MIALPCVIYLCTTRMHVYLPRPLYVYICALCMHVNVYERLYMFVYACVWIVYNVHKISVILYFFYKKHQFNQTYMMYDKI